MTRRATFTEAELTRAVKAARKVDPTAVVELVTPSGTIRISPSLATQPETPQKRPVPWD